MIQPEPIAIFIPDEDAKKFLLFQEHYNLFSLLLERNVFNQKNCAITLHFDSQGKLQVIQRADYLYSAKHEK